MIPLIEREVADGKKWIDKDEFAEMLAFAQSAPGAIAVNTAIFVGYKLRGWRGSLVATLGAIIPSFVIILLIVMFFISVINENSVVERIFKGIRPVVVALIAVPACNMLQKIGLKYKPLAIAVGATLLICLLNVSPVAIMIVAGALGIANGLFSQKKEKQ